MNKPKQVLHAAPAKSVRADIDIAKVNRVKLQAEDGVTIAAECRGGAEVMINIPASEVRRLADTLKIAAPSATRNRG